VLTWDEHSGRFRAITPNMLGEEASGWPTAHGYKSYY
jgi:hypothetical protein